MGINGGVWMGWGGRTWQCIEKGMLSETDCGNRMDEKRSMNKRTVRE